VVVKWRSQSFFLEHVMLQKSQLYFGAEFAEKKVSIFIYIGNIIFRLNINIFSWEKVMLTNIFNKKRK